MSITITKENKNSISVTNESRGQDYKWGEADFTWGNAEGTWELQRIPVTEEPKNNISVTNETK